MSHIRPDGPKRRRGRSECRKGRHAFGPTQQIGGGISRRVCTSCSAVSIDLSGAHEMGTSPTSPLARRAATQRRS